VEIRGFLTVLQHDAEGIFALWRRKILIQVRRGKLTVPAMQALEAALDRHGASQELLAIFSVVEPGAQLLTEEARAHQKAMMERFMCRPEIRMAAVVLGDDVVANLMRSSGRLILVGNQRIQKFSQLAPALGWLHQELVADRNRPSLQDLASLVDHVRGLPTQAR
jgi:hypothetical protein